MISRISRFYAKAEARIGSLSLWQKLFLLVDYGYATFRFHIHTADYFKLKLYEKNNWGKSLFVADYKKMKFVRTVNDSKMAKYFREKDLFIEKFKNYTNRDALNLKYCTEEEFRAFVTKHNDFFVKPIDGFFGLGAYIEHYSPRDDITALFKKLSGKGLLAEEIIQQADFMAKFNESSVNTLRVVTFIPKDGQPIVMPGALIRTGRTGKAADNFHHGGIGAQIDVETGIVCTKAIDKDGNRYVVHPDSGTVMVGFRVPCWKEVCDVVKAAALVVPEVRYVGWDVAITKDSKIVLIEGNHCADPDLAQMSDGIGVWPMFKKYLDEFAS